MSSSFYKLILTSRGLNTTFGKDLLKEVFIKEKLNPSSILLCTFPAYEVDDFISESCIEIGFDPQKIYFAKDYAWKRIEEFPEADYIYVTEGNTFEIMDWLRKNGLVEIIRDKVRKGSTYIGASAGAILASGHDFRQAQYFDSNDPNLFDFAAFGLMPGADTCIPHYDYSQLQNYLKELTEGERERYSNIYNISNEEALILDCEWNGDSVRLVRKKRIRLADMR